MTHNGEAKEPPVSPNNSDSRNRTGSIPTGSVASKDPNIFLPMLPDAILQNLHESGIIHRGNPGWIPHCLAEAADALWRLSEPLTEARAAERQTHMRE